MTFPTQQTEPQWEIANDDALLLSDEAVDAIAALLIDFDEKEEKDVS